MGGVKLTLDLAIGATSEIESEDKSKIESIALRVKELNGRLMDIRREQVFQRVSEFIPSRGYADGIGTRGRISGPKRIHKRKDCEVDINSAGCIRCHVRVAVVSFKSILYQAEVDVEHINRESFTNKYEKAASGNTRHKPSHGDGLYKTGHIASF